MRERWQEWVIFVSVAAIAALGLAGIWGPELGRLWSAVAGDERPASEPAAERGGPGLPASGPATGPL